MEEFESRFSDLYVYWGLGDANIRQNRFNVEPPISRKPNQIFWVGSVKPNKIISSYYSGIDVMYRDSLAFLPYTTSRLRSLAPISFLQHPKYYLSQTYFDNSLYFRDLSNDTVNASIFIIDKPATHLFIKQSISQSLLSYSIIENGINTFTIILLCCGFLKSSI